MNRTEQNRTKGYPHLKVKRNKGEDEALEVLNEIVKDAQPFRIIALLDIEK